MANYSYGSVSEWKPVPVGMGFNLPLPDAGYRKVKFEVSSMFPVEVGLSWFDSSMNERTMPLFSGQGMNEVSFSVDFASTVYVAALNSADAAKSVLVRHNVDDQEVPESEEATLTNIEPREAGPAEEMRRMLYVMNLNQQAREAQLQAEWEAKWAERDDDGDGIANGVDPTPSGDPEPVVVP